MHPPIDLPVIILTLAALGLAVLAYLKDPGLPWLGAQTGLKMLWFVLPRLVPALILAGLLQVVIRRRSSRATSVARRASRASSSRPSPASYPD